MTFSSVSTFAPRTAEKPLHPILQPSRPRTHLFPFRFVACLLLAAIYFALLGPTAAWAISSQPTISEAQAWCITDETGALLASSSEDELFAPASITKVLTACVALDKGVAPDTVITIPQMPEEGWEAAQRAGYAPGTTATFKDLLAVMLVYSANDAAYAIAEYVGGSQAGFAQMMNEKAQQIGMTNSTFKNPHGLEEEGHLTCARDLCLLGRYALTHYPLIAKWVHTPQVTVPVNGQDLTFSSTDELMGTYKPLIGIKTGKVEAGCTFLGAARKNNVTLYTCVLGCATSDGRFRDTRNLMEWAFSTYKNVAVTRAGQTVQTNPFAFRYGYEVPVSSPVATHAMIWPDDVACSYTRTLTSSNQLLSSQATCGAEQWRQGDRIVAATSFETGWPQPSFRPYRWTFDWAAHAVARKVA